MSESSILLVITSSSTGRPVMVHPTIMEVINHYYRKYDNENMDNKEIPINLINS